MTGDTIGTPFRWSGDETNFYAALLVPVSFPGTKIPVYMQVDFGAPSTIFYQHSIATLPGFGKANKREKSVDTSFKVGEMTISSRTFAVMDYGNPTGQQPGTTNIVGTIGTDLLEKRAVIVDFRANTLSFVERLPESSLTAFEFKKRKIIIPAKLNGKGTILLYDSGTSGYELITTKEVWGAMRRPGTAVKTERGNSWGKTLDVFTAPANGGIKIGAVELPLHEVTYIEGMPEIQKFLMRRSGMKGMIGNKIFLGHRLLVDARSRQFGVE